MTDTELTELSVEEVEALEVIELPDREALSLLCLDVDVKIDVDLEIGGCKDHKC